MLVASKCKGPMGPSFYLLEKIILTTLSGLKKYIFGVKGVFLIFFGFFQIWKLFWNQNRHIWGGQRKGKNQFDHSLCLLKDVFRIFPILGVKGVFFGFFGFFQNPKTVLESEQAHLGGSEKRKKSIWPLFLPFLGQWRSCSNFSTPRHYWLPVVSFDALKFWKEMFLEGVQKIISFLFPTPKRQKEWSNWFFPFLWPPQMCLFWFQNSFRIWKTSKKNPKRPLLHQKCVF